MPYQVYITHARHVNRIYIYNITNHRSCYLKSKYILYVINYLLKAKTLFFFIFNLKQLFVGNLLCMTPTAEMRLGKLASLRLSAQSISIYMLRVAFADFDTLSKSLVKKILHNKSDRFKQAILYNRSHLTPDAKL